MPRTHAIISQKDSLEYMLRTREAELGRSLGKIDKAKGHAGIWSGPHRTGRQLGFVTAAGNSVEEGRYLSHIYSGAPGAKPVYRGYVVDGVVMRQQSKGVYVAAGHYEKSGKEYIIFAGPGEKGGKLTGVFRADKSVAAYANGQLKVIGSAGSPDEAAAFLLVLKHA